MKSEAGTRPEKLSGSPKTAMTLVLAIAFLSLVMFLTYLFITASSK